MQVFFLGYPGGMGGANTECWHTAKLWREHNIDVTFIPTWGSDQATQNRLAAIGCKTVHVGDPKSWRRAGLAGSMVVGMCNSHVFTAGLLKDLGCRLAWVNCMTFLFDNEMPPCAGTARRGLCLPVRISKGRAGKAALAAGLQPRHGASYPRGVCL